MYLGTSAFAAAVLARVAGSSHRPVLVVTRPDAPRGRGRRLSAPPVAERARELGIDVIQPSDLHAPETLERIAAAEPEVLLLCAYGAWVKEALLERYEILNLHPSLLPRWRGAAPIERAIMAGDERTGVAVMRLTAGLDSGPVCLVEEEPILPSDDYGTLAERLERRGGDLMLRALDERPAFVEQPEEGVTYAEKITAADRILDAALQPAEAERVVRALRPHIGARVPVPAAGFLGVWAADPAPASTPPGADARVRREGDRLLLDCDGGSLELLEVQPPGGRRMPAAEWLRGRPGPELTDFWLDPSLPGREVGWLVERALDAWSGEEEWDPRVAALCRRGDRDVLDAMRALGVAGDGRSRSLAAFVLGRLGVPERTLPDECATALGDMAAAESDPPTLAAIAHAYAELGPDRGCEVLARLARHDDPLVRLAAGHALAGRSTGEAVRTLIGLADDPHPEVRSWAVFALGSLVDADAPGVRAALAAARGT